MTTTYYLYKENANTEAKELVKVLTTEHQAKATVEHLEKINEDKEVFFFYTYTSKKH